MAQMAKIGKNGQNWMKTEKLAKKVNTYNGKRSVLWFTTAISMAAQLFSLPIASTLSSNNLPTPRPCEVGRTANGPSKH